MRQIKDNSAYYPEQSNTYDVNRFFYRIFRKWHWFAISIIVGIFAASLYNKYMPEKYSIRSSMIVNEYESGIKRLSLSQNAGSDKDIDVLSQDHAGRLKSHILSYNSLQSLEWTVFWYLKTPVYGQDLYGNEPYKVILLDNKTNLTDVRVFISRISDSEYQVKVSQRIDTLKAPVKFTQKGKFGVPFENKYFGFILERAGGKLAAGENYYFVINNLSKLALIYQKKLKVISSEKKPDMMELILSENTARRGVDYLNRLEQTYIEYGLDEKNRVAENTMKFIDSQLKSVTDSLSHSENQFTNFRTRTQTVDLNQAKGIVMQKQETLESETAIFESRLSYLRSLRNDINDSRQMKHIVVPAVFGITDQNLNSLVNKLSDLYSRREVLSFSVQEKAPSLILLDKEILLTNNMLAQNINSLITATETDLKNLSRRSGGFNNQLSLLPKTEQQLSTLKRSFDLNNDLYTYLLKMRAESAITYASNQPDVKVLDPARIETSKQTSPIAIISYILGILLGFLIPFSIVLINEYTNNSVQSKQEVEEMTKLPVLGMVIHNNSKKNLVVHENPRSNITESFRLLRTNLKYMLNGDDKKVIAVQSTIAREGKSFISINLASILAMNNYKVLLVGVDMHLSNLDKVLKSRYKNKGLSTYLSNQDSFDDILESTPINNLHYISSGPVPPNPAELLENGNFERLMKEAKSRFDYIILDSPPVSLVTDGIITGRHADINLFVIRFRFSSKEQIKLINEHEVNKTLPNLILVLNDAIKENFGRGNYYAKENKGYFVE